MKTTQLANVLIRIIGLYFFLTGLSRLVFILPTLLTVLGAGITGREWGTAIIPVVLESGSQLVLGIAVIRMSHKLTKLLFRDDNELPDGGLSICDGTRKSDIHRVYIGSKTVSRVVNGNADALNGLLDGGWCPIIWSVVR